MGKATCMKDTLDNVHQLINVALNKIQQLVNVAVIRLKCG